MTGRYKKVEERRLAKLLLDTVRQAVRVLKADAMTSEWTKGIEIGDLHLEAPYHDKETSRHTGDDRDVYVIEGVYQGEPAMFRVDYVHEEEGDRRGHCVYFDIYTPDHHLDGSVYLPLPGEDEICQRPFVNLRETRNI